MPYYYAPVGLFPFVGFFKIFILAFLIWLVFLVLAYLVYKDADKRSKWTSLGGTHIDPLAGRSIPNTISDSS